MIQIDYTLWIQGSAARNALGVQFGGKVLASIGIGWNHESTMMFTFPPLCGDQILAPEKLQELCTGKAKGAISNYEDIASSLNCNILTQKGISFFFPDATQKL